MTMSGIWTKEGDSWTLNSPEGFPDEATLHSLIEQTPEMLPLSGAPPLLILGREVRLGSGYADLVGVETSGRPVIIEVKLAYSSEARRAVVAQILAYAAHLHGTTREQLEDRVGSSLRQCGHESLVDAVRSTQEDAFDADGFTAALEDHLQEGRFRLVFVLDSVPPELMTLVAYLEHVTDKLVIDLVAVNSFNVGGRSVVLPQRVTPERHEVTVEKTRRKESGDRLPQRQRGIRGQYRRGCAGAQGGAEASLALGLRPGTARPGTPLDHRGGRKETVRTPTASERREQEFGGPVQRGRCRGTCLCAVLAQRLREEGAWLQRADRGTEWDTSRSRQLDPGHQ